MKTQQLFFFSGQVLILIFAVVSTIGENTANPTLFQENENFDDLHSQWTQVDTDARPNPRAFHKMAFNSLDNSTYLFGGNVANQQLNDTWRYNQLSANWERLSIKQKPLQRERHSLTFDTIEGNMYMFGGYLTQSPQEPFISLNDTWIFTTSPNYSWTKLLLDEAPPPRNGHAMVFDTNRRQIILFGGVSWQLFSPSIYYYDTWSFDIQERTWIQLHPAKSPSPRWGHQMIYDTVHDKIILFGGDDFNEQNFGDTWIFDPATSDWLEVSPKISPSPRDSATMVFDSTNDRAILFGGYSRSRLNDTWMFDYDKLSWEEVNVTKAPPSRWGSDMVYDQTQQISFLFGGSSATGDMDDSWILGYQNTSISTTHDKTTSQNWWRQKQFVVWAVFFGLLTVIVVSYKRLIYRTR
ncbi:MAG: Kelch repeat-containing protein [Candidatus Kariarchaeaceae archaeon]|jgi:N-acetylneuraminic acid mutarotase